MKQSRMRVILCGILCVATSSLFGCNGDSSLANTLPPESSVSTTESQPDATSHMNFMDRNALPENTYSGLTIVADTITAAPGEKRVPVRVMLYHNTGYNLCGIRLVYDGGIIPLYDASTTKSEYDPGAASLGMISAAYTSPEKHLVGYGAFATDVCEEDGVIFTSYFDIPADATAGTVYPMTLEIEDFKDANGEQMNPTLVNGCVVIQSKTE